ncbi:hypothetical protein PoHVEF18_001876 [Penicillium ochrochloron]
MSQTPGMSLSPRVWLVPIFTALLGWFLIPRYNDHRAIEFLLLNNRSALLLTSTPQGLLDIDDALVSESNPARTDGTFDHERCARLHNYLVAYGWMANHEREVDDLQELLSRPSFFELERGQLPMHRFNPELISFMQSIIDPGYKDGLFYWVGGVDMSLADWIFFQEDENFMARKERFVILHGSWVEIGSHNVGLVFDQKRNQAAMPIVMENLDSILPVEDHLDMWYPLETMLTNWIHMLRIGKVTASPAEREYPTAVERLGTWTWHSYSAAQVDSAVVAMNRLSAAIEARMPSKSLLSVPRESPLLTDAELDAASVAEECFIRSVLTRVKTPRFKFIAPGLEVPHDASAFAARQKFTDVPRYLDPDWSRVAPPVLIFANTKRTINFNEEIRWLFFKHRDPIPYTDQDPIPVGLYSEFTHRGEYDVAEEGFRLLLPFTFRPDWGKDGARKSDGGLVSEGLVSELFQFGYHPFGGEWRPQRLERLMDRWRELVESGVWRVGKNGVKGGIDKFQDADYGHWRDYWIPPDW